MSYGPSYATIILRSPHFGSLIFIEIHLTHCNNQEISCCMTRVNTYVPFIATRV